MSTSVLDRQRRRRAEPGTRPSVAPPLIRVNVIMHKLRWVVRAAAPDGELKVFAIPPNLNRLDELLKNAYPEGCYEIDYAGLYQVS